jgi:hypothetical protein
MGAANSPLASFAGSEVPDDEGADEFVFFVGPT